jgi:hypothetical protein
MNARALLRWAPLLSSLALLAARPARGDDWVAVLTPPFLAAEPLSRGVATTLNLQVWRTFRKAPSPNPDNLDFGNAVVQWRDAPSPTQHQDAEALAARYGSDLVLWGSAQPYGDQIVVHARLTIPEKDRTIPDPRTSWRVNPSGDTNTPLLLDLPSRRYEFAPIRLTASVAAKYQDFQGLTIYDDAHKPKGVVTNELLALRHEGKRVFVSSGGTKGWLQLLEIDANRTEVVDFVAGVVRVMRGDYVGARDLLRKVINHPHSTNELIVDAYLYQAFARERQGQRAKTELEAAEKRNPFSKTAIKYRLMSDFVESGRRSARGDRKGERELIASVRTRLDANAALFSATDPFITSLRNRLGAGRPSPIKDPEPEQTSPP